MADLEEKLYQGIRLVHEAMPKARNIFLNEDHEMQEKPESLIEGDLVGRADFELNEFFSKKLAELYPNDALLGEESAKFDNATERVKHPGVWIFDPIDGTKNFAAKREDWCIMLGYAWMGKPTLGIIGVPMTGEVYFGSPNMSYVIRDNELKPLHASNIQHVKGSHLIVSDHANSETVSLLERELNLRKVSTMGSTGLRIMQVAEGKADFTVGINVNPYEWDLCAPEAILLGAGGRMSRLDFAPLRYNKKKIEPVTDYIAVGGTEHFVPITLAVRGVYNSQK